MKRVVYSKADSVFHMWQRMSDIAFANKKGVPVSQEGSHPSRLLWLSQSSQQTLLFYDKTSVDQQSDSGGFLEQHGGKGRRGGLDGRGMQVTKHSTNTPPPPLNYVLLLCTPLQAAGSWREEQRRDGCRSQVDGVEHEDEEGGLGEEGEEGYEETEEDMGVPCTYPIPSAFKF